MINILCDIRLEIVIRESKNNETDQYTIAK